MTRIHHTLTAGLILGVSALAYGQTASEPEPSDWSNTSSVPSDGSQNTNVSNASPSSNRTESSLFYFLNMSGKTQADFKPLTAGEKAKFYARGLFSPVMLITAGASAGLAQARDIPSPWGQGMEGYGERFGNYVAKQALQRTLRLGGELALHEDNRYYASGEHGVGRRMAYAVKSSFMARSDDGRQHISISEIVSLGGAAFISRTWQPPSNNSMQDGFKSFGFGIATNTGTDILREFLPDITRHIFRRNEK
jgi:hypothetical protein